MKTNLITVKLIINTASVLLTMFSLFCFRSIALRRKMLLMKEEKRRQDILEKRREEIREATEKFQRLNKNYVPGVDSRKGQG